MVRVRRDNSNTKQNNKYIYIRTLVAARTRRRLFDITTYNGHTHCTYLYVIIVLYTRFYMAVHVIMNGYL